MGKPWKLWQTLFSWAVDGTCSRGIKWRLLLGRKTMANLDSILKSRDIILPTKVYIVKATIFFSSQVQLWESDHKEWWVPKNLCFWTVVLDKTLESPLDSNEIKPANPKGNQPWIFIGRTDGEADHLMWKADRLVGKDPDAGKDWR